MFKESGISAVLLSVSSQRRIIRLQDPYVMKLTQMGKAVRSQRRHGSCQRIPSSFYHSFALCCKSDYQGIEKSDNDVIRTRAGKSHQLSRLTP